MNELLRIIRLIPVKFRLLTMILVLLPVVYIVCKALGMSRNAALFVMLGVLVIGIIIVVFNAILGRQQKKKAQEFEDRLGVAAASAEVSKEEVQQALRELQQQWRDALQELKGADLSIYDLPWFLLIGEPQSGKTTTLINSGLEFPVGNSAISGAGGTRNCDWWFTNEGVILDTAGRFTFQEDLAPDRHEWDAFLSLIRRNRRYCPINGVVVVIPATTLMEDSREEQEAKANNIREKLLHLQRQLEIRFPVFVLVTKADRILGFADFFDRLDPVDQLQMFGWSNPDTRDEPWKPETFPEVFRGIVERVHKVRLKTLREDLSTGQVDRLFVFPEELAALEEPLDFYLQTIFTSSRFQEPFMFRGFYISSGVQQGRPIARACRDLLKVQAGDPQGVLENLESVFTRSRAFFIRDFYEKKLFPEQGLIAPTRASKKKEKVYTWVFRGLIAAAAVMTLILLLPAALNLYKELKPVSDSVSLAQKCLAENSPCSFGEHFVLIERIEESKRNLGRAKWTMRVLLRGRRNEVTDELLPAIQASLFSKGVLPELLATFEARSNPEIWRQGNQDYLQFFDGVRQVLRIHGYRDPSASADRRELRREISIKPILGFIEATSGTDPSEIGGTFDKLLAGADLDEWEEIFQAMVQAGDDIDALELAEIPSLERSFATFEAYWRIDNLADSDFALLTHIEKFLALENGILSLDLYANRPVEQILREFSDIADEFSSNWDKGTLLMSEAVPTTVSTEEEGGDLRQSIAEKLVGGAERVVADDDLRPGEGPNAWERNCNADFSELQLISNEVITSAPISERCGSIPQNWETLKETLGGFEFMYSTTQDEEGSRRTWSEAATLIAEPLVQLGMQTDPGKNLQISDGLSQELPNLQSDQARLERVGSFLAAQEELLLGPVIALQSLDDTGLPNQLQSDRLSQRYQEVASLVLARRTLPPLEEFFVEHFDNPVCRYTKEYAQIFVPSASNFISRSSTSFQSIGSLAEIEGPIRRVNEAQLAYLERFVERERGAGGGGGGGFVRPAAAGRASTWSSFVSAIRNWQPVSQGQSAPAGLSGGLTPGDLQSFAHNNDLISSRLSSLSRGFGSTAAKPRLSPQLVDAADMFQQCVAVLSDDPQEAWKQLAFEQDGASLGAFHAFSSKAGISGSTGNFMRSVESRGSSLLSDEIRPRFKDRSRVFWASFESCCRGRFPFVTGSQLSPEGYSASPTRSQRSVTEVRHFETVALDPLTNLFFGPGNLEELFQEFALDPLVSGGEKSIDFVGADRQSLAVLRAWQRYLHGEGDAGDFSMSVQSRTIGVQLIDETSSDSESMYLGERVNTLKVFGSEQIRPSNPRPTEFKSEFSNQPLFIRGIREGTPDERWETILEIGGGPLKLFYFLQLAGEKFPSNGDGRVWRLRIDLPDYSRPGQRLRGNIQLNFDRPVPEPFSRM